MSLRLFLVVSAMTLVNCTQALSLEPLTSRADINEVVSRVGNGQVVRITPPKAPTAVVAKPRPNAAPVASRAPASVRVAAPKPKLVPETRESVSPPSGPRKSAAQEILRPASTSPPSPVIRSATRPQLVPASQSVKPELATVSPLSAPKIQAIGPRPAVKAKALYCLDCSSNRPMLAENISEPLPIASITKLLTAMAVIDEMNLDSVLEVPDDIKEVERHTVGIRPGDLLTVGDLLHGMLIESGNDCAEVLARSYSKGGRSAFIALMNRKAQSIGASRTDIHTPSGLDLKFMLGRKDHRSLLTRKPNLATAEDVAVIAREAFKYPLIREISGMKSYTMRTRNHPARQYALASNDKLLHKDLPVAGAKTGFTNMAGRCIVARFKNEKNDYVVVVLNTPHHFKAAERIYRWACKAF